MSADRLLVVAAHPDDEVLGCGGTIARFADEGKEIRIIFLAEGITARYNPSQFQEAAVQAAIKRRNDNAIKALAVLGVTADAVFLGQRYCCRLDQVPMIELVKEIERHIAEFAPTHLFTHASADTNIDHGLVHRAVLTATRPLAKTAPREILAFEVLSSTEWNATVPFPAQVFYDVGASIDRKVKALAAYEDEMRAPPHPRSEAVVRALACYRGAQVGLAHAEGFAVIRQVHSA